MQRTLIAAAGLVLAAPLLAAPAHAGAVVVPGPSGPAEVTAGRLLSPLSLDVTPRGVAWFSQNFAGQLMRQRPGRPARSVLSAKRGAEVGAVSAVGRTVTFAVTSPNGRTSLKSWSKSDGVRRLAGLSQFEQRRNPDAGQTYGVLDLDEGCEVPPFLQEYTGIVESHPYASLSMDGLKYVADAAANAILSVDGDGRVRTVAVLPPQPYEITAEAAEANGLPPCTVGKTFAFEPVPTDVERGPGGMLYVTTLPGGPEDPSLGARAAVHRVDPGTGDVETIATGLLSATGLALDPAGNVYVAELFRNRIAVIPNGSDTAVGFTRATMPGDVEFNRGRVWATRKVLTGLGSGAPRGQVVRYPGGAAR